MMKPLFVSFALLAFASPAIAQEEAAPSVEVSVESTEVITANVNGMVCDFCARAVTKVFGKRDEVAGVDVDLDEGQIIVTMNEGQSLDDDTVKDLIKKSGYAFVSLERSTDT